MRRCRYLLWKNDGNAIGKPTYIYLQRLSADGMSVAGQAVSLIRNTEVLVPSSVVLLHQDNAVPCVPVVGSRRIQRDVENL